MSDKREVLIQVKDLKKYFGNNKVLDGITTDIRKGEVVAIIGHPVPENPLFCGLSICLRFPPAADFL